jgi:hypothetical protein
MAKHRGGLTVYDKQDMVISQFERTNRNEQNRKEPTWIEKQIEESRIKTEEFKAKQAKCEPQPNISHYNPDNILTRTKYLSPEDRKAAIKQFNNEQKAAAKLAAENNA